MSKPNPRHTPRPKTLGEKILFGVGILFIGLGLVGFALPVIPTTPFVLVASFCLIRSSPRLHDWLRRTRWAGPILRDWHERGGVRPSLKIGTALMVAVSVGLGAWLATPEALAWVVGVGLINLVVVLCLPNVRREKPAEGMGTSSSK